LALISMNNREYIYAFLSRVFADALGKKEIEGLKDSELLKTIGEESCSWFNGSGIDEITEILNVEYASLFMMSNQPIESSVIDNKSEILVGLQNPVMLFYHKSGYEFNLLHTHLQIPDHIAIEFGFMQNLIVNNEIALQREFLSKHLAKWAIPYLVGCKFAANTVFYGELCDFAAEFIASDLEFVEEESAKKRSF